MHQPHPMDPDLLLQHASWVRGLARSILGDEHLADDVTQQTLMAAVKSPPHSAAALPGWMRTVARNFGLRARRDRAVRVGYESASAKDTSFREVDLVELAEIQQMVVEAVLSLPEPYRGVILERYFEDITPAEIARRRDVPAATVRTHLHRGLEKLREQLTTKKDRHRALVLLAGVPSAAPLSLASKSALAGAAALIICCTIAWTTWPEQLSPEPSFTTAAIETPPPDRAETSPLPLATPSSKRADSESQPDPEHDAPEPPIQSEPPGTVNLELEIELPGCDDVIGWRTGSSFIWLRGAKDGRYPGQGRSDVIPTVSPVREGRWTLLAQNGLRLVGTNGVRAAVFLALHPLCAEESPAPGFVRFFLGEDRESLAKLARGEPLRVRQTVRGVTTTLVFDEDAAGREVVLLLADRTDARQKRRWPNQAYGSARRAPAPYLEVPHRSVRTKIGADGTLRLEGLPRNWALIDFIQVHTEFGPETWYLDQRKQSSLAIRVRGMPLFLQPYRAGRIQCVPEDTTALPRIALEGRFTAEELREARVLAVRHERVSSRLHWPLATARLVEDEWSWSSTASPTLLRSRSAGWRFYLDLPGYSFDEIKGTLGRDEVLTFSPKRVDGWTVEGSIADSSAPDVCLPFTLIFVAGPQRVCIEQTGTTSPGGCYSIRGLPEPHRGSKHYVIPDMDRLSRQLHAEAGPDPSSRPPICMNPSSPMGRRGHRNEATRTLSLPQTENRISVNPRIGRVTTLAEFLVEW